ncbi:IucA/IucC family protein [Pseudalkalibacillus hwajinpoensis]|uniref:IucA/IucC family siderophore biosynthesis protein n=1 Tax=Guptibacillus hwajinpoensis TaxID=208199 RepID=A0A4U1MP78_9BACL|nr:IucA/IucC family protein [Pseudalkalibacillus hwajinpoensis]TKD72320.1 hypothetical protein FBF83_05910 [Pseudalkalibacillus hwajinpoensis]
MKANIKEEDGTYDYASEVVTYLQKEYPHFIKPYKNNLNVAEKVILNQLIQAILREQLMKVEWLNKKDSDLTAIIKLNGEDERIEIPISKVYTLSHIDIAGDIVYANNSDHKKVMSNPSQFLSLLTDNGFATTFDHIDQFFKEITNSTHNYALALTIAEDRKMNVQKEAKQLEVNNTMNYVLEKRRQNASFSPLVFFEQWVIQGHTIHPCSRTRLGLSPRDVTQYAPEWSGEPNVIPVAVHQKFCQMTKLENRSATNILLEEYPEVSNQLKTVMDNKKLNLNDYELIPVHPWQFENTIKSYYKDHLDNNWIVPLEGSTIETAALVSFRSLAPLGDQTKHHIKTAMNVQMTSAIRTVSAASTRNGPKISSVLQTITANDSLINSSLRFMSEEAGIHFEPDSSVGAEDRYFLQKNLASIIRENPEASLTNEEIALPAAALINESPVSNHLLMEELIMNYARNNKFTSISEAAEDYIGKYASVLFPGVITLITKYGISMEVHLQNCVCVFQDGLPERMIVRDNGGIRIMNERLSHFIDLEEVDGSTNLMTENAQELLDVFYHALIHNHLGEVIVALSRKLQINEAKLWQSVRNTIEEIYASLTRDSSIPRDNLKDKELMMSPESSMKALVKMRLTDKFTENAYVDIANPLSLTNEV